MSKTYSKYIVTEKKKEKQFPCDEGEIGKEKIPTRAIQTGDFFFIFYY